MTTPERNRKLDQAMEDEIVAEYEARVAIKQIARKFGVAQSTIYYVLARNGVEANRTNRSLAESHDLAEADRKHRLLVEYLDLVEHRLSTIEAATINALRLASQTAPTESVRREWDAVRDEWEAEQEPLRGWFRDIRDAAGVRDERDRVPRSDGDTDVD